MIIPEGHVGIARTLVANSPSHANGLTAQSSAGGSDLCNHQIRQGGQLNGDGGAAHPDVIGLKEALVNTVGAIRIDGDIVKAISQAGAVDSDRVNQLHGLAVGKLVQEGKFAQQLVGVRIQPVGVAEIYSINPRPECRALPPVGDGPRDIKSGARISLRRSRDR